jgi:hypothetical protein
MHVILWYVFVPVEECFAIVLKSMLTNIKIIAVFRKQYFAFGLWSSELWW